MTDQSSSTAVQSLARKLATFTEGLSPEERGLFLRRLNQGDTGSDVQGYDYESGIFDSSLPEEDNWSQFVMGRALFKLGSLK